MSALTTRGHLDGRTGKPATVYTPPECLVPCPTCNVGPSRETVGMVCQTCGTDYAEPAADQSPVSGPVDGLAAVDIDLIARLWRDHANCTWVSTGVNVMWSCGILHPGPIHMQPTTRGRHLAALVMTQVEADRAIAARVSDDLAAAREQGAGEALRGVRFRVETACEGYGSLMEEDVPPQWESDDYRAGAAAAARGILHALNARTGGTE